MLPCPRCGAPIPAPGAPCPRCLVALALDPQQAGSGDTTLPTPPLPELGSIGPYRLLSVLGEGGMGTVYLAEQREPIHRRVALKIVRAGVAGKEVLARFEAERQALALMTHAGIARVLDAGTTADGAPFFAMEYVHGEPITDYCDRKRLSTEERLDLFRQVCAAVQHAHQRGILHRDLKPSNILVEEVDGEPRPRIIDFGLAKALNQRLTERTLFTERGAIVGTPEYMSPEQAAGEAFDVDTTTDVYSLGVVVYELLTGSLPHDPQRLREAGWLGMMKILREEEAKKPSTKVSTFNEETASTVATKRKTEPKALLRSLRGDLDWIILRALDKERERRYPNVSDLAADLERHLTSDPVTASPPSAAYRASKFVRRHRWGLAAATVIALLVFLGVGASTFFFLRARDESLRSRFESARNQLQVEMIEAALRGDSATLTHKHDDLDRLVFRSHLAPAELARLTVHDLSILAVVKCDSTFPARCWEVKERFDVAADRVEAALLSGSRDAPSIAASLAELACEYELEDDWSRTERFLRSALPEVSRIRPTASRLGEFYACLQRIPLLRSESALRQGSIVEALAEARRGLEAIRIQSLPRSNLVEPEALLQLSRVLVRSREAREAERLLPEVCDRTRALVDVDEFGISPRVSRARRVCGRLFALAAQGAPPVAGINSEKSLDFDGLEALAGSAGPSKSASAAFAVSRLELTVTATCGSIQGDRVNCAGASLLFDQAVARVDALLQSGAQEGPRLAADLAVIACEARLDDSWERTERLLRASEPELKRIHSDLTDQGDFLECRMLVPVLRSRYLLGQNRVAEAEAAATEALASIRRDKPQRWDQVEPIALAQCARLRALGGAAQRQELVSLFHEACHKLYDLYGPRHPESSACLEDARRAGIESLMPTGEVIQW